MLLPLITQASWYACEGRPYGLLLGFCARLGLLARRDLRALPAARAGWTRAEPRGGRIYPLLCGIDHRAAGRGGGMRTWTNKRVDIAIWAAFLLGLLPLLAFMPLMAACRTYAPTFWSKPSWRDALRSYSALCPESATMLMALLFLTVVANAIGWPAIAEETPVGNRAVFPPHDFVAAMALAAMPVFAVALAIIGKLGYTPRYAITTVIGVSLLAAATAHRLARGRTAPAIALSMATYVWYTYEHYNVIEISARASIASNSTGTTVPHDFRSGGRGRPSRSRCAARLYLESINGRPTRSDPRLVFVSGEMNTATRSLLALSRLRPLNVVSFASFLAAHKRFLLIQ